MAGCQMVKGEIIVLKIIDSNHRFKRRDNIHLYFFTDFFRMDLHIHLQKSNCIYYDYQLSKAWTSFGDEVLEAKLRCCHRQLSPFPLVHTCNFALIATNDINANKLPLEMEPVTCDNNTSWTSKPGHQPFVAPYSTDNRSIKIFKLHVKW